MILVDTDVMIDVLRQYEPAQAWLKSLYPTRQSNVDKALLRKRFRQEGAHTATLRSSSSTMYRF